MGITLIEEKDMKYILLGISLLLAACGGGKPADITPVQPFNADRYLGKWYEIARFDHGQSRNAGCRSTT